MAAFSFIGSTSFPGFFLLLRETALVVAGNMAPKIWGPKIRERKKSSYGLLVINNCRYDKSYSVGAGEQFAASFITS